METQIFEMSAKGGLQPVNQNVFKDLQPGTVIMWGGNMAWGPTRFCILYRRETSRGEVMYDGFNMDEPSKNSHLHGVESWSIKDPNDKSVWHSQHMFLQPETVDAETVEQYKAMHEAQRTAQEDIERKDKAEADRLEALGRELWPSLIGECPAVIVAEHEVSDCDGMTDYYASHTDQRVILAPSFHKRDLFPEMRKAAALIEETRQFATVPSKPADANEWWHPEDEHREKYSMGHGYYLGNDRYSGWQVSKEVFYKGTPTREDYICLAKRHDHLQKSKPEAPKATPASAAGFEVTHDRDWTWVKFAVKPAESTLQALRDAGARFSHKRMAWYFARPVEETEISHMMSAPEPAKTLPSRFALGLGDD